MNEKIKDELAWFHQRGLGEDADKEIIELGGIQKFWDATERIGALISILRVGENGLENCQKLGLEISKLAFQKLDLDECKIKTVNKYIESSKQFAASPSKTNATRGIVDAVAVHLVFDTPMSKESSGYLSSIYNACASLFLVSDKSLAPQCEALSKACLYFVQASGPQQHKQLCDLIRSMFKCPHAPVFSELQRN